MAIRPSFVSSNGGHPGTGARGGRTASVSSSDAKKKPALRKALPAVWDLLRPRRWLLIGGFGLMIINRVAGLVLPGATKFLVDNVMNGHPLVVPRALQPIAGRLMHHDPGHLLPVIVGAVLTATFIQGITSFTLTQLLSKAAQRLITDLRMQVQQHIGRLSVSFYDTNRTGVLVSRIMSDVEGVRNLLGTGLVEFAGGLLTSILAFAVLIKLSPGMTGLAFAVMLVFTLILSIAFKTIRPIFRERGKITAEVTGRLTESLGGVRVIKGYHAEDREAGVFAQGVKRLLDNVMKTLTAQSFMSLASTAVLGIVGSLVMYFGAHQVLSHKMTTGGYFAYTMFLAYLVAPIFQMVAIGTQLTEAVAGLDRTHEILSETTEDADPLRTENIPAIVGEVKFEDVEFSYETDKPVLHGISFVARPGTVNAFVGSSGAGKSTIISLICAFHVPNSGRILVDGYDLAHVRLDSYRSQLGVVLQESFLFDGTIRENVSFSRPNATEAQILEACRIARVDEFAERFPEKYDTIVGERGVKLSGGQRQRISIARAILADPRILILDEATSSLDSESEALIQEGLQYLMRGRTTFVIAHRLSTIRRADQILVIEDGRVVEHGTHPELLANDGRYRDLYNRQHGLEMNLFLAPGEGDKVEVEA
jgi:ABC-type multidrug transport system fused ATPase/permease subunit